MGMSEFLELDRGSSLHNMDVEETWNYFRLRSLKLLSYLFLKCIVVVTVLG